MSVIRRRAIEGLQAGDAFTVSRTFDAAETRAFGVLSRDYNPVHYDERWAAAKRLDGLICHGLLVGSLITEIGGQIGWLASGMDFRFRKPVFFGDTVTCVLTITEVDERGRANAQAVLTNQHGVTVLEAAMRGFLPGAAERSLLAEILAEADPDSRSGAR